MKLVSTLQKSVSLQNFHACTTFLLPSFSTGGEWDFQVAKSKYIHRLKASYQDRGRVVSVQGPIIQSLVRSTKSLVESLITGSLIVL